MSGRPEPGAPKCDWFYDGDPEVDQDGIPICSENCPHYGGPTEAGSGAVWRNCDAARRLMRAGEVCRPAVAEMARSLEVQSGADCRHEATRCSPCWVDAKDAAPGHYVLEPTDRHTMAERTRSGDWVDECGDDMPWIRMTMSIPRRVYGPIPRDLHPIGAQKPSR
jgi:hypothetical protein